MEIKDIISGLGIKGNITANHQTLKGNTMKEFIYINSTTDEMGQFLNYKLLNSFKIK